MEMKNGTDAFRIVQALEEDIDNRSAFGQIWRSIKPDIREQIKTEWYVLVERALGHEDHGVTKEQMDAFLKAGQEEGNEPTVTTIANSVLEALRAKWRDHVSGISLEELQTAILAATEDMSLHELAELSEVATMYLDQMEEQEGALDGMEDQGHVLVATGIHLYKVPLQAWVKRLTSIGPSHTVEFGQRAMEALGATRLGPVSILDGKWTSAEALVEMGRLVRLGLLRTATP